MQMPDYRNMSAVEAMRHAKEASGMTTEEIARAAGISCAVMRRYLQRGDDGYCPGLDRIAPLCLAMRNRVLIQWLEAQLASEPEIEPAKSRAEILTAAARAAASLGDAQRVLADSENRGIDPACAREVRSIFGEVIEECRRAKAMLAELGSHRDTTEVEPLASLKPKIVTGRKWWEIWK